MNGTMDLIKLTATVREIAPAPAANRSGKIKTTDGLILSAFPDKLQLCDIDGTYEFGCIETQKNNVVFRDVKTVRLVSRPQERPRHEPEVRQPARSLSAGAAPSQRVEPSRPATSPNGNSAGQYYRPTSPRDSERMFVCSTLNAFISTGRVECHRQVIAEYIGELRAAYADTFGRDDQA